MKLPSCYEIAASADESILAVVGHKVLVVDAVNQRRLLSFRPLPHPSHADFSLDAQLIAVKSTSGRIVVVQRQTGEVTLDCRNAEEGEGPSVWFSYCGKFLVDASWKGAIRVRQVSDASVVGCYEHEHESIHAIWPTKDRSCWYAVHQPKVRTSTEPLGPPYVTRWRWPFTDAPERLQFQVDYRNSRAGAVSPSGDLIAFAGQSLVAVFSCATGAMIASSAMEPCKSLRWSNDGQLLLAVMRDRIALIEPGQLREVKSEPQEYASDAYVSTSLGYLVVGGWSSGRIVSHDA
jgi:hypothetical protein